MSGDARSLPWTRAVYDRPRDGRTDGRTDGGKPERDERGRTASGGRTGHRRFVVDDNENENENERHIFCCFRRHDEMKTNIETEYEN